MKVSKVLFENLNICKLGFPSSSDDKESACHAGNLDLIPGSERYPAEGNGDLFQYSCSENPMDRGAWWAIVHRVTKSQTWLKWLSTHESKLVQSRVHPWWQTPETWGQRFCLFSLLYNDTMQKHQWRPWGWAPTMWVHWLGRLLAFLGHYLSDFNGVRLSQVFFNLHRFWCFPNILLHCNSHRYAVTKGMLIQASHVFHWDHQLVGRILQRIQFLGSYGK